MTKSYEKFKNKQNLQIGCWILSCGCSAMTVSVTLWNKWSKLGSSDVYNQANPFSGIWHMCDTQLSSKVIYTCYDKFSSIPTFQAMRFLMVMASIFSCACTVLAMFFMECSAVTRNKDKISKWYYFFNCQFSFKNSFFHRKMGFGCHCHLPLYIRLSSLFMRQLVRQSIDKANSNTTDDLYKFSSPGGS